MGLVIINDRRKLMSVSRSRDSFEDGRRFRKCLVSTVSLVLDKITRIGDELLHPHSGPLSWDTKLKVDTACVRAYVGGLFSSGRMVPLLFGEWVYHLIASVGLLWRWLCPGCRFSMRGISVGPQLSPACGLGFPSELPESGLSSEVTEHNFHSIVLIEIDTCLPGFKVRECKPHAFMGSVSKTSWPIF